MSDTEPLQKLAALERQVARTCQDPDAMDGEAFARTLEPLLAEIYRVHRVLCRTAGRRARAPAPRPT